MSDQKVVVVTGASSGVGQATARLLSQRGYRVFGTSRNPVSAVPIPTVEMVALDVRDDDSVGACVNAITSQVGRLDVLVNNAGYELAGALEELSIEEAKAQFETNFFGVVRMVQAVLPHMRQQQGGQIINISSLAGLTPIPFMGIYSASKFALIYRSVRPRSQALQYSCITDRGWVSEQSDEGASAATGAAAAGV
jgi:NADP-dependent 3-hydroxy acid dehydrogenase YdfG